MCGIGGIIDRGTFDKQTQIQAIKMLYSLQDRGTCAFGVYLSKEKNNYNLYCGKQDDTLNGEIFKTEGSVKEFFFDNEGKVDLRDTKVILFHTRASTKGSPSINENNHPFNTKDFILAHNGVIHNDDAIRKKYGISDDNIQVDSYVIIYLIQKYYDEGKTIPEAIEEMSREVTGGYACWLYHKPTKELYLFRHNYPISYTFDDTKFYFASEDRYIKEIDDTLTVTELEEDKIFKLNDMKLEEVGKLHTTSYIYQNNIRTLATRNDYDDDTISPMSLLKKIDKSLLKLYALFENYENKEHTNTIIALVNTSIVLLVKPRDLVLILDKAGFDRYKTSYTNSNNYTKYIIRKGILINQLVENIQSLSISDIDLSYILNIMDALNLKIEITEKEIVISSPKKPNGLLTRIFEKAGLTFGNDNKITLANKEPNKEKLINLTKIIKEEGIII